MWPVALRFEPSAEVLLRCAAFVAAERERSPSLSFELRVEPGGGPLWLRLGGGPEAKPRIRALVACSEPGPAAKQGRQSRSS